MTAGLITDFGLQDAYAAVMKAVILDRCPDARIIDISHDIEPRNVPSAAFVLYSAWNWFPPGTVFLAVVDPGVGTGRRECIVESGGRFCVCPDNGITSLAGRMNKNSRAFRARPEILKQLAAQKPYYAATFDGRDLFAPLAAMMLKLGRDRVCGERIEPVIIPEVFSRQDSSGDGIDGYVMHLDRFGNAVTSIHVSDLDSAGAAAGREVRIQAGEAMLPEIQTVSRTYADAAPGGLLAYWGSAGFLEIAVREGNFGYLHKVKTGNPVKLRYFHA